MNYTLRRTSLTAQGIFGRLFRDATGDQVAMTLERSYFDVNKQPRWEPKLACGLYTCVRGLHKLAGAKAPFETFEVTGVPDFRGKPVTGILFHVGNWAFDSEGCVLLGQENPGSESMIIDSRKTFTAFMASLAGIDQFQLTVKG